jgi:high affinity Mn2+ porin
VAVIDHVTFTADYQFIGNPAYNRDRGPVSVFAARVHVAY